MLRVPTVKSTRGHTPTRMFSYKWSLETCHLAMIRLGEAKTLYAAAHWHAHHRLLELLSSAVRQHFSPITEISKPESVFTR